MFDPPVFLLAEHRREKFAKEILAERSQLLDLGGSFRCIRRDSAFGQRIELQEKLFKDLIRLNFELNFTDILITMVYKVAFTGQSRDYGLASAYSIIIFIIVAVISIIAFRRTKSLEELN